MTRNWALSIAFYFCTALALSAQTIELRTGDHATFSRIVMPIPTPEGWQLKRAGDYYQLTVSGQDVTFDTSRAFDLITKQRIRDLVAGDNGLKIYAAPETHAWAFELPGSVLVIDVREGPAPPNSQFERPIIEPPTSAAPDLPVVLAEPSLPVIDEEPPETLASAPESSTPPEDYSELETALIEQLTKGISAGVLRADVPDVDQASNIVAGTTAFDSPTTSVVEHTPDPLPPTQLELRSGADVATDRHPGPPDATPQNEECLPDHLVALEEWGDADARSIGAFRARILGEFDSPSDQDVIALVRYYLRLGFGAEARALLRDFNVSTDTVDILYAMSDLVETGSTDRAGRLKGQHGCSGKSALWSALTVSDYSHWDAYNHPAIQGYFSALPPDLRRQIGPYLGTKYLEAGDAGNARRIQTAIARADQGVGDAFKMLEADALRELGRGEQADEILHDVAHSSGDMSATALIALVTQQLDKGSPIDPLLIDQLEALSTILRYDPIHPNLVRTRLLAQINNGDIDAPLRELADAELDDVLDEATRSELTKIAFRALTEGGDDLAFMRNAIALGAQGDAIGLPDDLRFDIAARAAKLGFARSAAAVLSTPKNSEGRALQAQLLLAQNQYPQASIAAKSLDETSRVKFEFDLSLARDEVAFSDKAIPLLDEARRDTLLWLTRDWPRIEVTNTDDAQTAFAAMRQNSPPNAGALSLANMSDALTTSRQSRATISAQLSSLIGD